MSILKLDVYPTSKDELKGKCPHPNHKDNNPSWFINSFSGLHQCKSCGFKGNLESLSRIILGGERSERLLKICSGIDGNEDRYLQAKIKDLMKDPEDSVQEFDKDLFQKILKDLLTEPLLDPLVGSKVKPYLTKDIIEQYGLKHWTLHGSYYNRIATPIIDLSGSIVNVNYRALHGSLIPKYQSLPSHVAKIKGDSIIFYNEILRSNKPTKYAFIVEGVFDAIFLGIHGYPSCATFSSQISFQQMGLINEVTKHPIILFDGDESGFRGNLKTFYKYKQYLNLSYIKLPKGHDPDDLEDFGFLDWNIKRIFNG